MRCFEPDISNDQRGAVTVEFALLALLLFVLLFGIIEFGFLWMQSHYIRNAAREGARAAAKLRVEEDPAPVVQQAVLEMLRGVYGDELVDNPANCCGDASFIAIRIDETTLDAGGNDLRSFEVSVDVRTADIWDPVLWDLLILLPGIEGAEVNAIEHIRGTALFVRQDQTPLTP